MISKGKNLLLQITLNFGNQLTRFNLRSNQSYIENNIAERFETIKNYEAIVITTCAFANQ